MDLHKEWQKWQESAEIDKQELHLPDLDKLRGNVKSPLKKIKNMFYIQFSALIVFSCLLIYILVTEEEPLVNLFIFILLLAYIVGSFLAIKNYLFFLKMSNLDNNMLSALTNLTSTLRSWMKFSEKLALFLYPIASLGGYMYGFTLVSPLSEIFEDKIVLTSLIVYTVVSTPVYYYLSKWINKKTFAKYLNQLDEYIEAIEN